MRHTHTNLHAYTWIHVYAHTVYTHTRKHRERERERDEFKIVEVGPEVANHLLERMEGLVAVDVLLVHLQYHRRIEGAVSQED